MSETELWCQGLYKYLMRHDIWSDVGLAGQSALGFFCPQEAFPEDLHLTSCEDFDCLTYLGAQVDVGEALGLNFYETSFYNAWKEAENKGSKDLTGWLAGYLDGTRVCPDFEELRVLKALQDNHE